MNAGKVNINTIFNKARKLEVPFYQRAYIWGEEQWSRLLEDLNFITVTNKPYFIGSIILKEAKVNTWEVVSDKKVVVDGQQRLTTLMLFFRALCLLTGTIDKFDSTFRLEDDSIALSLGFNDDAAFSRVMVHDKTSEITDFKTTSNIITAFNYFLRNIKPERYNRLTINKNLQFVCIDLDENEDEQQVFDTINSLGVRLTTAELLKNYFYSREDIESYKKNWVQVFESDDDTRSYWNQEFETGRITRTMIDVFFDSYFQLFVQNPQFRVSGEDKIIYDRLDRLALSYQDFIKNYCHGDKQVVLAPMAAYAAKFKETFDPNCLTRHMSKTSGLERINVIIFGLKTTTLIPYVLYLTMNVEDQEEYNKMLTILEAYVMRRIVTRQSTKNYNNLFVSMILNKVDSSEGLLTALKRYQDSTTSVPSDDMLKAGFDTSRLSNLQAKGVIYFIESGIRTEKSSTALLGFNQYSLEHLMPRKWRNHWEPVATAEEARNRDFKLATLGNFAIITQSLNTSISDGDWKTKKTGKKGNPGLEQCASGLLTMVDVLAEDAWDEEKIENRAGWLFEKAKVLWNSVLPAVDETSGGSSNQNGNRAIIRKNYWSYALPIIQKRHAHRGTFSNCNPTTSNTEAGFFGISGFSINCIANYDSARVDFWMGKSTASENKAAFDILYSHKEEIENELGISLTWERAEQYKGSWLSYHLYGVSVTNEADWEKMAEFHAEWSDRICNAVLPYLQA